MKRCVIVGGADINNFEYIKSCLRNDDFIVFCDSGLKHLESLQVKPGLIVGGFDSHDNPHLDVETIVLPCEKDDTDTVFAVSVQQSRLPKKSQHFQLLRTLLLQDILLPTTFGLVLTSDSSPASQDAGQ